MSTTADQHECDLFLMTSHHAYAARRALPEFARLGDRNVHGWGIGGYCGDQAVVVRDAEPATDRGQLNREFAIAAKSITSAIVLGHLRFTSRGRSARENNHPFVLPFLGYEWMLIHNGTARRSDLVPHEEWLLVEADNDTARVFEFLRGEMIRYLAAGPKRSLLQACRQAYAELLNADPDGSFNLVLSNGHLSFVFIHWRDFYCLRREKDGGDASLVSTIPLTISEDWVQFSRNPRHRAKYLAFNGPTLVHNGDI